jgi:hypothetical protein
VPCIVPSRVAVVLTGPPLSPKISGLKALSLLSG